MASIMLGMDFYETEVYVALWSEEDRSAHAFSVPSKSDGDAIPLCVIPTDFGGFIAGADAVRFAARTGRESATHLYGDDKVVSYTLEGQNYSGIELMTGFIEDILNAVKRHFGGALISRIGITGERLNSDDKEMFSEVLTGLGYEDHFYIENHANSFLMYMACADEARERQRAADIELNSRGASLYSYYPSNRKDGCPSYIENFDTTVSFPVPLSVISGQEEKTESFDNLIRFSINATNNPTILYVTGHEMEDDSLKNILRQYASKRMKVFLGQNMYAAGACYTAVNEGILEDMISDGRVLHSVSLEGYKDAVIDEVPIIPCGTPLEEADRKIYVIPDNTSDITFRIKDARTGHVDVVVFSFDTFKERENKTTRLEISVRFLDLSTLVIKARDMGFGDFYKATYKIFEKIIDLT